MSTSYITPNLSLVIPVPTAQLGPNWAYDINASLTIIDAHNHTPGSGVLIPTSGLNINADLSFNNINNAVGLRSVRFFNNTSALVGIADLGCVYEAGGDFYYNNASGTPVQITSGNSVLGSTGTITGLPSGTASAAYLSTPGTFEFLQATGTAANIDAATLIVRYPGSYPTPSGNYIAIQAPSSLASAYSLTLPAIPAQTNVMTLNNSGIISSVTFDAVGQTMTVVGANAIGVSMNATGANAVANTRTRNVASSVGAGGVAVSASCGAFSTSSGTYVPITNLSVTITSSAGGRPIRVLVIPDNAVSGALAQFSATAPYNYFFQWQRNGTPLNQFLYVASQLFGFKDTIELIDFPAANTTNTYALFVKVGGGSILVDSLVAVAYEL